MATVIRYVDPDATGAGDGTSWTDAYTSLSAWEAAEQTDLVTDGDNHICYVRNSSGSDDTADLYIYGWTTGASNKITIQAATGYETDMREGGDGFVLKGASTGNSVLMIRESYVEIEGIAVDVSACTRSQNPIRNYGGSGVVCRNCLFIDGYSSRSNTIYREISLDWLFENCGFIGSKYIQGGDEITFYNCAVYSTLNQTVLIRDVDCNNVVGYAAGGTSNGTFYGCTGDYNCGDDATAPGANSLDNKTLSDIDFVSTTAGSVDLHIQSTSDLVDAGIGPGSDSDVPSTDPDGDARSGSTCDIGFDEYNAGSTVLPRKLIGGGLVNNGLTESKLVA